MPYISPHRREALEPDVFLTTPGELNFVITRLADRYIVDQGLTYSAVNEVIGVLECAKLELYARIARPYEDTKIEENGDVYTCNKDS